jgi:imidazoleglycerol-phosphate dehydratase
MKERKSLPLRQACVDRTTRETRISLELTLDGTGEATVSTGIGFLDHCLEALAKHSLCNLQVNCQGDLHVDGHHSVEDIGICLGQALAQACGDKRGISRFGLAVVPMDEALVEVALDFSGRAGLGWHSFNLPQAMVGDFDVSLSKEFFRALTANAGMTAHFTCRCGENSHHIIEATFKAFARALNEACRRDPELNEVPSTKGVL